jgi:peptide/nickel transport system substrate-binding protein
VSSSHHLRLGLAGVAATAVGATCLPCAPTRAGGELSGGTVIQAVEQEYTTYNNNAASAVLYANTLVLNMVQPKPFITQPDLSRVMNSELMEAVEVISSNPLVVEWRVNPEAVWSDGEPIDCDDFHLDWIARNGRAGNRVDEGGNEVLDDNGNPVPIFDPASTTGYEDIESLECSADGFTITTTFSAVFVDYNSLFEDMMPAHVVERETEVADVMAATEQGDVQALGEFWNTGFEGFDPDIAVSGSWYTIDSFTPGETLILVRNDSYWGTPGLVDEIVFRLIPSATDMPAALGNGDVHVIAPQPNPDLLVQLDGLPDVSTSLETGVTFEHFDFNLAHPLLAELDVRRAVAHCIDRQEILDTLITPLDPDAVVLDNRMYMPIEEHYVANDQGFEAQDLDAARALMEGSGFILGDDGVYQRDGERASFRVGRRDPNPRRQQIVELASAQCAEAGIELVEDASEDFNSTRLPASDYDIALFGWVGTPFQSSNTSIYTSGGGQNWNNYANEQVDALFAEANAEFDPERRIELMNQIDVLLWDDMLSLPLFAHPNVFSHVNSLQNAVYNDPQGPSWNANDWSVTVS